MTLIPRSRRTGFTLVEIVSSLLASSLLLMGLGASIFVASQANEPNMVRSVEQIDASQFLLLLQQDLAEAIEIESIQEKTICFSVADRDQDGMNERIRYEWSGVSRSPIWRQQNQEHSIDVLELTSRFELSWKERNGRIETVDVVAQTAGKQDIPPLTTSMALWNRPTSPMKETDE